MKVGKIFVETISPWVHIFRVRSVVYVPDEFEPLMEGEIIQYEDEDDEYTKVLEYAKDQKN